MSNSDHGRAEELRNVESKTEREEQNAPAGDGSRSPDRNGHQDAANRQQQQSDGEHVDGWSIADGSDQRQEGNALLADSRLLLYPARLAMASTLVPSNPRSAKSVSAALRMASRVLCTS